MVREALVSMTSSALSEYLMDECRKVVAKANPEEAAAKEAAEEAKGEEVVKLSMVQLKDLLLNDSNISPSPLQVMSILGGAYEGDDGLVDCDEFIPIAASTIEHMFDPAFLKVSRRRSKRSKGGTVLLHFNPEPSLSLKS